MFIWNARAERLCNGTKNAEIDEGLKNVGKHYCSILLARYSIVVHEELYEHGGCRKRIPTDIHDLRDSSFLPGHEFLNS